MTKELEERPKDLEERFKGRRERPSSGPKMIRSPSGELLIERFSRPRRMEHTLVVLVFVTLVLTGFPQKFDDSEIGHWVLQLFGGLDNTRLIHRVAGFVFAFHAVVHIASIIVGGMLGKISLTLLPVPRDLRDAWETLGYYFGRRTHPPDLPKFDYRQKFEYIGLILGGMVMITSGLILFFPVFTARYLPAVLIPAAHVAHSSEAMLALSVLVVWHIYGSVFSPEIFPLDRTIFTGYISAAELKERHAREYRRLFPDGLSEVELGEGPSSRGAPGQGASGQGASGQGASGQGASGQGASGQGANTDRPE